MKRTIPILLLAVAVILFCTTSASAKKEDLPEYIIEQLHKDITYTIITERNVNQLDDILSKAKTKHFLVVQTLPEDFKQEHADKINAWVNEGGIAWFYDSRLASFIGMKNSPLKKDAFQGKDHTGGYGTGRVPGVNTLAQVYPFNEHPVVTGVQTLQVFLMEVGKDEYSAVDEKTEGTIPLFRVNIDPKAVIAAKQHGKGWIIFKPLLWPDVMGGERFQANLMEFSAGYPVPKGENPVIPPDAFQGKPVKLQRYDNLLLSDGQQVIGMVTDRKFEFMGPEGTFTKDVKEVAGFKLSEAGHEMVLTDGKQITGTLLNMYINFKTPTGKTIKLEKQNVTSIMFNIGETIEKKTEEKKDGKN